MSHDRKNRRRASAKARQRSSFHSGVPRVILLIESARASGRNLLTGIAAYTRHHGPWAFYWEPAGLDQARPSLKTLDAHGIILRDVDAVEEVLGLDIPAVVVGHSRHEIPGLVNVVTDSDKIGTMAAEHVLERGFRHFAYCGYTDTPWSQKRGEVFSRRVAEAGFQTGFYVSPEALTRVSWRQELLSMAHWLQSLPTPLALMACNDDRGQHVIEACKVAGIRVPVQVAVIGADNDELVCELSDPRLSSVAINFERAGYESAARLDQLMHGQRRTGGTIVVPATHIVTRQSTDMLAIEHLGVAKALRFIRDHAKQPVHVSNVAKAAGMSRRALEKRFRESLHRSVLGEIRRVRIAHICRMLVETNQPVSQIALDLGFSGPEHIARYFRKDVKMTPLRYRRAQGRR
ncbi:MAG: DNA-binding transcriptional regulator [Verrucomicrobia bacterium]|nr:DNA-binding transcriptional regulator [Verrucomicrobiota bacterium]